MSETNPATTETTEKKGGKKFLIISLVAVLLLGGGGGGFYFWRSSAIAAESESGKKKPSKKAESKSEDHGGEDEKKDPSSKTDNALATSLPNDEDVKAIVELPPFIVNLADTEQARYLRMTVSLGIEGEEGKSEKPDPLFMTRVRNTMLAVLSDKKSDEILSVEGKAKLRKQLLEAAQAASEEPKVHAIYITDFIVQL